MHDREQLNKNYHEVRNLQCSMQFSLTQPIYCKYFLCLFSFFIKFHKVDVVCSQHVDHLLYVDFGPIDSITYVTCGKGRTLIASNSQFWMTIM